MGSPLVTPFFDNSTRAFGVGRAYLKVPTHWL